MATYLGLRGTRLGSVISAVCGLCFLCFGYAQGVLGGLLTVPAFLTRFPQIDTINNPSLHNARLQGITMGTWNLGCFASALLTIFVGDLLGRKKTLLLGLTLWSIGEIVQCSSYSFGQFLAGRFIAGFGNGFTTSTVPAYQAECVKSHRKGTILMISAGALIAAGLALSYWFTFAFAYISNASAAWRVPIAFQIIFAVIAFLLLIGLPESPRWLILTGREQEALKVLSALNDEDEDGPEIRDEFLQIKDAVLIMSQGTTSSLRSNNERRNLHRVILAYFVQAFQQLSGINLALQYLALMFLKEQGYTGWVARLLGACASTEYFLASFVAVVGIDRFWGRRSLMLFGACGMSGCMVLLAVLSYLWQIHQIGGSNIAASVFLFGFATFFAIGWQGMAWLYQVEIVPLRIRGPANALSTSGNWMFNFIVVFISPIAFHNIGWRTYIIFAATNFAIIPLVYFLYPETAFRSLEEVDVLFHLANEAPGNPWLNVVKISQEEPLWFGKKGNSPFDYSKSDWHQRHLRHMESGTTLGRGSENEKNNTPSDETGNGVIGQTTSSPESEPNSSASDKKLMKKSKDKQPNSKLSKSPATRPTRTRRNKSDHSVLSERSEKSIYSVHLDSNWQDSELAPSPLRVPSRDRDSNRPLTSESARAAVNHRRHTPLMNPDMERPPVPGMGIHTTPSGSETYYPSGLEADGWERPNRSNRPSLSSNGSWSRFPPREAGRGH